MQAGISHCIGGLLNVELVDWFYTAEPETPSSDSIVVERSPV